MTSASTSTSASNFANTDAWDLDGTPEIGSSVQPWRAYWPPKECVADLSAEELAAQPWLTWKRDPAKINDKPWYQWVNDFGAMNVQACEVDCPYCGGGGCVSRLGV